MFKKFHIHFFKTYTDISIAAITTKLTIRLDSGPKVPPLKIFGLDVVNFNNEYVALPLTFNPNMGPKKKFQAVWIPPQIQMLSCFKNIMANSVPIRKIFTIDIILNPSFPRWGRMNTMFDANIANRMPCLLAKYVNAQPLQYISSP